MVTRHWSAKKDPHSQEQTATRYFLSSLDPSERFRAAQSARGHWSVENKNHYKRDTCLWLEDDHRHRRPKAAQNLALMRNALMAIIPYQDGQPLAEYFELYHRCPAKALRLILHASPCI